MQALLKYDGKWDQILLFDQFLLDLRAAVGIAQHSTDVFLVLGAQHSIVFGSYFSPGFTHGSLSPFDASILPSTVWILDEEEEE